MSALLLANPKKRKSKKRVTRRRLTSSKTTVRRYRKNPARRGGMMGGMVGKFMDAAVGGAGALAVDVAMKQLPFIPPALTTGPMAAATKGVISLGIGMLVSNIMRQKKLGEQLAAGGMTVAMYEVGKEMVGPAIGLGYGGDLLGYYGDDTNTDFADEGMGYYGNANTFDVSEDF